MGFKTLHMNNNLEENVYYERTAFPIAICIDDFDEYLNQEWCIHWHSEYEFGIVTSGKVQFSLQYGSKEKSVILHEGDGIFINTGILHSAKALKSNSQMAEIIFKPSFFGLLPLSRNALFPVSDSISLFRINNYDCDLLQTMNHIKLLDTTKEDFELECIELVCKLWRKLSERMSHLSQNQTLSIQNKITENRIKHLLSYIHKHYSETISSEELAKAAGISRTECFHLFKTFLRKTPTGYLTEYRLTKAVNLLTTTDKTITEISLSCGFNNPSYFCKIFKKRFGVTPVIFKNKNN